jgi:NADH-quinone oxidoreductase subunit F
LALIFNFFAKNLPKEQKDFLENLDIGYLSAESNAGTEHPHAAQQPQVLDI